MDKNWVKYKNGDKENFIITIKDKQFFCTCGANVFKKYIINGKQIYVCNGCDTEYEGI